MINLLPDSVKNDITLARRNTKLRRWMGIFMASILGIAVITLFGLFYINTSIADYTAQNQKIQQELKDQKIDTVEKQVQDISDNLKLTVKVLSKEILFSSLIKQIGTAMPNNAILTGLQISKTTGGLSLSARAKDYNTAAQVLINLQDPHNKIFDKADINSIVCSKNNQSTTLAGYPCTIELRVQFAKNNPFLFINSGAKK